MQSPLVTSKVTTPVPLPPEIVELNGVPTEPVRDEAPKVIGD